MSGVSGPIIQPFGDVWPSLAADCRLALDAVIVGDVQIGAEASLWWGVVVRGDDNHIRIGARTNVQDGTVVHVTYQTNPTLIGDDVTIGHAARLHGCEIGDGALIGIGAIVLDGAVIEPGGFVAAGALVTPGKVVRSGELWGGSPARKLRDLTDADKAYMSFDARHYVGLATKSLVTPPRQR